MKRPHTYIASFIVTEYLLYQLAKKCSLKLLLRLNPNVKLACIGLLIHNIFLTLIVLAHIKGDFIRILISLIESPLQNDTQDVLSDIMVNLILSINLQFDDFTDSIVMDAYREEKSAKIFTEKILVLLNREGKLLYNGSPTVTENHSL